MAKSSVRIKKVCEWCGKEFYALKTSTRFCSKQCNGYAYKRALRTKQVKSAEEVIATKIEVKRTQPLKDKEFLSPKECAEVLNIALSSIYKMIYQGKIPAFQFSSRFTRIRKSDIDSMMSSTPYVKRNRISHTPITDFYTTAEVASKYGVNESWIFKVGKEQNIPKVFKRGKTYWSAKHFDKYFASKAPDSNITEWYSVEDLTEKFGMTTSAIYSFVSRFAIPKKKNQTAGILFQKACRYCQRSC